MLRPFSNESSRMATKKEPEKKSRTPKIVEEPAPKLITVTHTEDKNGARTTVVEGRTYASNNSAVEIHVGERVYHGGTTIDGEFRTAIPFTEEEVTVVINGETIA